MKINRVNNIVQLIWAMLVMVFLYTAIEKFRDQQTFQLSMEQSNLLRPYASTFVWLVPGLEVLAVLLLLIPRSRFVGLMFTTLMLAGFTFYIGYMLAFEPSLPCSCGGIVEYMSWKEHLYFNSFLIFLAMVGIYLSFRLGSLMDKSKNIAHLNDCRNQEQRRTPVK